MIDLNTIWFLLVGVLIIGYAILDGFDLGVGVLHRLAKTDHERRIFLNAVGPFWDGNEVWLLTGGGALFAAFPVVYATVFSAFYLALMLLLFALIFRAVSLEFRSKEESPSWRNAWDWAFFLGSLLPSILFGVALGNIMRGIPLDANGTFTGNFFGLLNPYSVLIGLVSLAMLTWHGANYLTMKTEGDLQNRAAQWANKAWLAFVILYGVATILSPMTAPHLFEGVLSNPLFYLLVFLMLASVIGSPYFLRKMEYGKAFLASSVSIASIIGLVAVGLFPRLVPSSTDLAYSLTIYNAASTPKTQMVMLIIALLGMPLVIGYTIFIYRQLRGKVVIGEDSY
ncbi:MAG: cytochrome d ubiquinol oxidase subunit II [Calditrichia bacterium]